MLAAVLQSPAAVAASIQVVRAFVRLQAMLVEHGDLARLIDALEARYEGRFKIVFDAIRALMTPPDQPARRTGSRPIRNAEAALTARSSRTLTSTPARCARLRVLEQEGEPDAIQRGP